uniref:Coiled-coil domain containing 15 n=1 Tax=Bubo bubo TaxID=30461 RepID=A0A8C0IHB7_BUBBB
MNLTLTVPNSTRSLSAGSTRLFNPSRDGDSPPALGSPFQRPTTPSAKKSFLRASLTLPWRSLRPFPLGLALVPWLRRLIPPLCTLLSLAIDPSLPPDVLLRGASSLPQRQNEYLRYRRLFMNIEREQVREQQRQKERQKRIAQIKSKKEKQRRAEEQRMREVAAQRGPSPGEGACDTLAQLKLVERREKMMKEKQRNKEHVRYLEALRAQMREKMKLYNIDLPPLCSCGSDFWDSHPDTCANNCVFYKNHKEGEP